MTDFTETDSNFDAIYLRTWTEPDADKRRALIEHLNDPFSGRRVRDLGALAPLVLRIGNEAIVDITDRAPARRGCGRWSNRSR